MGTPSRAGVTGPVEMTDPAPSGPAATARVSWARAARHGRCLGRNFLK